MNILILILAIFFAMNMGGASFAASFAASYGGKVINKKTAGILFIIFVTLGSVLFGENVSITLGEKLVSPDLLNHKAIIIIFLSAGLSMFIANIMKIPQSTSLVTVAAIAGVGVYGGKLDLKTLYYLIPFWILLPVLSYFITHFFAEFIYSSSKRKSWIEKKFANHQDKLKIFVVLAGCYNSLSVGANNVANIAGPLMNLSPMPLLTALFIFALFYGAGAFSFTGPLITAGTKIVPLSLLTASFISLVSATLMIFASVFGVPQSFVMIKMGAIFAISSSKQGRNSTFAHPVTKKTFYTWSINPVITFGVSYGLCWLIF